jgi:hypothetical protein
MCRIDTIDDVGLSGAVRCANTLQPPVWGLLSEVGLPHGVLLTGPLAPVEIEVDRYCFEHGSDHRIDVKAA